MKLTSGEFKVAGERRVKMLYVNYNNEDGIGREAMYNWMDEKYGTLGWRAKRSGPVGDGTSTGLLIAEIEMEDFLDE